MTTMLLITLLIGVLLGMFLGVPVGRFWERVRPSRRDSDPEDREG